MKLSIVIPLFNEQQNIAQLYQEIIQAVENLIKDFEIIFVNDASSDQTKAELKKISDSRVKTINFRRNRGQTAALQAGILVAKGELLVTMDGDLQNDPADIPKLFKALAKNDCDVVCGWRVKRKDSVSKRFISSGAKWLRTFLINDGIHDSGCTLRIYKKECFEDVFLRGEMHRFIPAILKWQGFKIAEIPVNHRPRIHGVSKYNWKRTVKGFLDMISLWFFHKYESRPLHMLGGLGFLSLTTGFLLLFSLAVLRFLSLVTLSNSIWPLIAVLLILFGAQAFISGLIMELQLLIADKKYVREQKNVN